MKVKKKKGKYFNQINSNLLNEKYDEINEKKLKKKKALTFKSNFFPLP